MKSCVSASSREYRSDGPATHVAGIIAGNGTASEGRILGIAPEASLVGLRVLDAQGTGKLPHMLQGIEWILKQQEAFQIRIVNISVGAAGRYLKEHSKLVQAVNRMWDAGIVVCVAAGNEGDRSAMITTPGISRKAITVGSSDDARMVDEYGQIHEHYSGAGPTVECVCKPEIVAPGTNVISANAGIGRGEKPYAIKSGTSMSTPIVSGAVALLLEKYPDMKNSEVKLRLKETAAESALRPEKRGWGLLDVARLLSEE